MIEAAGVSVELGDGWERVDLPGAVLALAGPDTASAADGTTFRPSFTVIVADAAPDADVRTLGSEAVVAAGLVSDDAHVVAYDVWPLPDGALGRRLVVAATYGAVPVCVTQWVGLRTDPSTVTTVTATVPVSRYTGLEGVLEDLAGQVLAAQVRG